MLAVVLPTLTAVAVVEEVQAASACKVIFQGVLLVMVDLELVHILHGQLQLAPA
jgi:hypothetical protein